MNNESVVLREKLHWGIFILPSIALLGPTVFGLVIISLLEKALRTIGGSPTPASFGWMFIPFLIPGLISLVCALISYHTSVILLTNESLKFQVGFLLKVSGELPLHKIESTFVLEPVLGRAFGYGTLTVIGSGGTQFELAYVSNPKMLAETIRNAPSKTRSIHSCHPVPTTTQQQPVDDSRYMPKPNSQLRT